MKIHFERKTQEEAISVAEIIGKSAVAWVESGKNHDMFDYFAEKTIESLQRQIVCTPEGGYIITEESYFKRLGKEWSREEYRYWIIHPFKNNRVKVNHEFNVIDESQCSTGYKSTKSKNSRDALEYLIEKELSILKFNRISKTQGFLLDGLC